MKNLRVIFWFIIILTIVAVVVDFPKKITLSFGSFKKEIYGLSKNLSIGPFLIQKDFSFKKGLDLEGGTSITLKADMAQVPLDQKDAALESAKTVIERRINFFGVSEPVIQTSKANNDYRIIVEIPGVTDTEQAINLIGQTAQLSFWEEGSVSNSASSPSALPLGITSIFKNPKKTDLTGKDLTKTSVSFDQSTAEPQVQLTFTDTGAKKFAEITKRNINKRVAIILDDQVIQAPTVNTVITGGDAVITGGFTIEQAKAVSIQLNAGALPVPLSILRQNTILATLGEASLQKIISAGILGFLSIVVFMVLLYGRLGFIACFALILYALYVLAIFKLIPITLTLAGIAGFILSIGMAVDANILIFERMKEELNSGRPKNVAIELGFSRAWTSIRDSNIASLITSFILYYFGTGPVKGFALTLAVGVLISMFSAITVTRTFLRMVYK